MGISYNPPGGGFNPHSPGPIGDVIPGTVSATTVVADSVANHEHKFRNYWSLNNSMALWNGAANGFSILRFLNKDGQERGSVGHANDACPAPYNDCMVIASSNYLDGPVDDPAATQDTTRPPQAIKFFTEGKIGADFSFYERMEIAVDGTISVPKLTPNGTLTNVSPLCPAFKFDPINKSYEVYNAYTDGSNYSRFRTFFNGNDCELVLEKQGTGTIGTLYVVSPIVQFSTGGTNTWQISSAGHLIASNDNTIDIGQSGATRPRNLYLGGNASIAGSVTAASFVGVSLTPTAVKIGSYTLAAGDFVPVDTRAGAVALTLPTAPADGTRVAAKMVIQGATNTVTITTGGSDVFNKTGGGTTYTISLVNQGATFQYKASGAIWYVVNDNLSLAQLDLRFSPLAGGTSFTTAGTITTGTWNAGVIGGQYGGTGVANTGKTITLAGNLVTTGAFNTTFAQAASITVTLPGTSATMARTDAGQTFTGIQAITYSDNGGLGGFSLTNSNSGNNAYSEIDITNNSSTHSLSFGLGGTGVAVNGGCFDGNYCYILGNGGTDGLNIGAGKAAGVVNFYSGGSTVTQRRMRLHASGGLSLGSITDPGATNFSVAGTIGVTGVSTLTGGANVPTLTASRVVLTDAGKNLVSGNGPAAQVVASGDFLAQTATKASVASYTTPNDATVHSFRVGGYANVTAISAGTLTMTVTFTDENNASQTITYFGMGLTSAGITTTGFTGFSSSYIRCKANTAITFVATFVGVSITYDVGASIESLY